MEERDLEKLKEYFGVHHTIFTSKAWEELQKREYQIGPEALLDEIIEKRLWTNEEIAWVLRRLIYYYGQKNTYLKDAPIERVFLNMVDILRAFFLLFDLLDPDIDDNMRTYICSKLADATWGVNSRTREYVHKIREKKQPS